MLADMSKGEAGAGAAKSFVVLRNNRGLHSRPAGAFVRVANEFNSDITLTHRGKQANGKSILSVMALEAGPGALISIHAAGHDSQAAVDALRNLVLARLGEPE
jgi:phosphotransferase system HPr (HPr) family protein